MKIIYFKMLNIKKWYFIIYSNISRKGMNKKKKI